MGGWVTHSRRYRIGQERGRWRGPQRRCLQEGWNDGRWEERGWVGGWVEQVSGQEWVWGSQGEVSAGREGGGGVGWGGAKQAPGQSGQRVQASGPHVSP